MKHNRTQGLLPWCFAVNTPAILGARTVYVTTQSTVPTRSEVLVHTHLATAMPVSPMSSGQSLERHSSFPSLQRAYTKAFKVFNQTFLILRVHATGGSSK